MFSFLDLIGPIFVAIVMLLYHCSRKKEQRIPISDLAILLRRQLQLPNHLKITALFFKLFSIWSLHNFNNFVLSFFRSTRVHEVMSGQFCRSILLCAGLFARHLAQIMSVTSRKNIVPASATAALLDSSRRTQT